MLDHLGVVHENMVVVMGVIVKVGFGENCPDDLSMSIDGESVENKWSEGWFSGCTS